MFWRSNLCPLVRGISGKCIFPFSRSTLHFAHVFFSQAEDFQFDAAQFFIFSFISLTLGDIRGNILLCEISEIL